MARIETPNNRKTGTKPLMKRTRIIETKRQNNETKQRNEKAETNVKAVQSTQQTTAVI